MGQVSEQASSIVATTQPPVGPSLPDWSPPPLPTGVALDGMRIRLEPLNAGSHGGDLAQALAGGEQDHLWTYMASGPFDSVPAFVTWLQRHAQADNRVSYALVDPRSGHALGLASYLRMDPAMGSLEIGHLCFGPQLQRTTASTEALYLLLRHAFDGLGYRRCEWKCDHLNAPSRRAAERLGFRFEGIHRQAMVIKGRNRDTAWYSILDREWPALRQELERWLAPENFDREGRQRQRLGTAAVAAA
ncbi:MAG: GNAT family N-acetyltransferase [Xanthomonadales bacterium]|nr:GNAT family N-acetyltransferase [Xanthomonadales bacterium]MCB1642006.1 GNAT family N-acetyltransferase [Xanthomonadales bacterium]